MTYLEIAAKLYSDVAETRNSEFAAFKRKPCNRQDQKFPKNSKKSTMAAAQPFTPPNWWTIHRELHVGVGGAKKHYNLGIF